jgi:hypothetical protein
MSESSREKQLEAILHGYLQAVDAGQNPDREELLRRYPDFADELREFFTDQAKMDRMAQALNQAHVGNITLGAEEAANAPNGLPRIRYFGDYELQEEIARGGRVEAPPIRSVQDLCQTSAVHPVCKTPVRICNRVADLDFLLFVLVGHISSSMIQSIIQWFRYSAIAPEQAAESQ